MVANSFLGEHRTMNGRLMNELREARGLNYGDYSYIEYLRTPPRVSTPPPGVPRREQYFSVWIRPVVPGDAQFALRAALYEIQRLRDEGMTQDEFNLTRDFVLNYSKLWAQSLDERLGFTMDSKFYGMPYYIDEIQTRLKNLTVADVNAAIKKYLSTDNYEAVMVTANAPGAQGHPPEGRAEPQDLQQPGRRQDHRRRQDDRAAQGGADADRDRAGGGGVSEVEERSTDRHGPTRTLTDCEDRSCRPCSSVLVRVRPCQPCPARAASRKYRGEAPTSTSTPAGAALFSPSLSITTTAGRGSVAFAGRSVALQPTTTSVPAGRRKR